MSALDKAILGAATVAEYDAARRELDALRAKAERAEGLLLEAKAAISIFQGGIDKALAGMRAK